MLLIDLDTFEEGLVEQPPDFRVRSAVSRLAIGQQIQGRFQISLDDLKFHLGSLVSFVVAVGSVFNSFQYACEIANVLEGYDARAAALASRSEMLAQARANEERERALGATESLRREAEALGEARAHHEHAAYYRLAGENPLVAGTGEAMPMPTRPFPPPPPDRVPTNGHAKGKEDDDA